MILPFGGGAVHKIWVYTAVLILIAFSFSVSAQELARVTVPVIVQVPQTVTLSVDKLEIVFVSSDFQDPELAVVTDEGVLVTKRRAINVRAVGNVGYGLLISTLSMPFKMEWRLNRFARWIPANGMTSISGPQGVSNLSWDVKIEAPRHIAVQAAQETVQFALTIGQM
jgi:hypothetical protein